MANPVYEGTFRTAKRKSLPKKILIHTDLPVRDGYEIRLSIWVADTPESNIMPTINLTLSHDRGKVRGCFANIADLLSFTGRFKEYIDENASAVHEKHEAAVGEHLTYHNEKAQSDLNDSTEYTVVQGTNGSKMLVNKKTGEITELPRGVDKRDDQNP